MPHHLDPRLGPGSGAPTFASETAPTSHVHDHHEHQTTFKATRHTDDGLVPRRVPSRGDCCGTFSGWSPSRRGRAEGISRREVEGVNNAATTSQRNSLRSTPYYRIDRHTPVCVPGTTAADEWVQLNVGGRMFTTTLATLCAEPNSVLSWMCKAIPQSQRACVPQGGIVPPTRGENWEGENFSQSGGRMNSSALERPDVLRDGSHEEATASTSLASSSRSISRCVCNSPRRDGDTVCAEAVMHTTGDNTSLPVDNDQYHAILLDLDPDYFAPVLNYLRLRIVVVPPTIDVAGVRAVAEYLGIWSLVRLLTPACRERRQLLYSWGSGGSGELGTRFLQDGLTPTLVQVTPFGVNVVDVALGANYSCALTDNGNIYTFGNGDWGQLGLGNPRHLDTHPEDQSAVVVVPRRVSLFESTRALHVAAGFAFAVALTEGHHVYFWGNNNHGQSGLGPAYFDVTWKRIDTPKLVEALEGKRIVQLGCGSFFTLALTADGAVYSWGLIECLGLGTVEEVREKLADTGLVGESLSTERRAVALTPQLINIHSSKPIVRIHAGQWHSGAISAAGELFTWGVGYQGRLGHGNRNPAYVPKRVRGALEGHVVVDVACGSFHTVALTATGAVFCWGDNASGQCGISVLQNEAVTSPLRVVELEFIAGGRARAIACGRQHTTVVMTGPQPNCTNACCKLDDCGHPLASHHQAYTFGETTRQSSDTIVNNLPSPTTNTRSRYRAGGGTGRSPAVSHEVASTGGSGGVVSYVSTPQTSFKVVPNLETLDVHGVVSGLHHTFVFAEEVDIPEDIERKLPAKCTPPVVLRACSHRTFVHDEAQGTRLSPGYYRHRGAVFAPCFCASDHHRSGDTASYHPSAHALEGGSHVFPRGVGFD